MRAKHVFKLYLYWIATSKMAETSERRARRLTHILNEKKSKKEPNLSSEMLRE